MKVTRGHPEAQRREIRRQEQRRYKEQGWSGIRNASNSGSATAATSATMTTTMSMITAATEGVDDYDY